MAEEAPEEDNASKLVNAAAREMVRVVKNPDTDEYLIVLDTAAVPSNAVLVHLTKWGTPMEKGAKNSEVVDDNVFICKPLKTRNPEKRPGKEAAQASYKLIKRHTGRFHPLSQTQGGGGGEKKEKKRSKPEGKKSSSSSDGKQSASSKRSKGKDLRESAQVLQDALKAIEAFAKHAK